MHFLDVSPVLLVQSSEAGGSFHQPAMVVPKGTYSVDLQKGSWNEQKACQDPGFQQQMPSPLTNLSSNLGTGGGGEGLGRQISQEKKAREWVELVKQRLVGLTRKPEYSTGNGGSYQSS